MTTNCNTEKIRINNVQSLNASNDNGTYQSLKVELDQKVFFKAISDLHNDNSKKSGKAVTFKYCEFRFSNIESKLGNSLFFELKFENCSFENYINWATLVFVNNNPNSSSIDFSHCIFKDSIFFEDICQGVGSTEKFGFRFNNCQINKNCNISDIRALNQDAKVKYFELLLEENTIHGKIEIERCNDLTLKSPNNNIHELFIDHCIIGTIELDNSAKIHIKNSTLTKKMSFVNAKQDFTNVTFNEEVSYVDVSMALLSAKDCIFKENVYLDKSNIESACFDESKFERKLYYVNARANKLSFSNCKFFDTVKIVNIKGPLKSACFERSTIEGLFFFNGWSDTLEIENNGIIDFSHLYIKPQGYLIVRNITNGIMNFSYSNILGTLNIQDSHFDEINFDKCTTRGLLNYENIDVKRFKSRETITRIKDSFNKKGDVINALTYRGVEMSKYCSELWKDVNNWKMWKLTDIFLLFLNTISNNNGRWWFQGGLFTISMAFIFYSCYSLSMGEIVWSNNYENWTIFDPDFWKKVLGFLWLPNLEEFKELTKPGSKASLWSYSWFILGKIFIAYGIYQTISAFRKYGK